MYDVDSCVGEKNVVVFVNAHNLTRLASIWDLKPTNILISEEDNQKIMIIENVSCKFGSG